MKREYILLGYVLVALGGLVLAWYEYQEHKGGASDEPN